MTCGRRVDFSFDRDAMVVSMSKEPDPERPEPLDEPNNPDLHAMTPKSLLDLRSKLQAKSRDGTVSQQEQKLLTAVRVELSARD